MTGVAVILYWTLAFSRVRASPPPVADAVAPLPVQRVQPTWLARSGVLFGRDDEVRRAVDLVLNTGVVAVVGPRGVGTSAVASAVVQALVDSGGGSPRQGLVVDVRRRSARDQDDPVTFAGRLAAAFGLDAPFDDTDEALLQLARSLVRAFEPDEVLFLDNVSAPEQVEWLVREWPATGGPRLVIAGETAVGAAAAYRVVTVGVLGEEHLRRIWYAELDEPRLVRWRWLRRLRSARTDDQLAELLRAILGRPRAVKAIAHEVGRPGSTLTVESLLTQLRSHAKYEGPLKLVWQAVLDDLRSGLTDDAVWLLHVLVEIPTSSGAIAAMLGYDNLSALEELRSRDLVVETDGTYRSTPEIRRMIASTTSENHRRHVMLAAMPALVRYHAELVELWAARLNSEPEGAQHFFRAIEPTIRTLFDIAERTLAPVLEDLARIADRMERWYVRSDGARGLMAVNDALRLMAERANRPDLAAAAAIRMAVAHRMTGQLDQARDMLDFAATERPRRRRRSKDTTTEVRERVERAHLALARAQPDEDQLLAAARGLSSLRLARRDTAGHLAVQLTLGALNLKLWRLGEAMAHLGQAEELARLGHDVDTAAESVELQGDVLLERGDSLIEAVRQWQRARDAFARIGDRQGEARCLRRLGSAALADPTAAGQVRDGRPHTLDDQEAASVALSLLSRAKSLRTRHPDAELDDELRIARARLDRSAR